MTTPPINEAPFDRFTLVHATSGLVLGALRMPWWGALTVSVLWEMWEPSLKQHPVYRQYFPVPTLDSWVNKAGDTAGLMGGWYAGSRLR